MRRECLRREGRRLAAQAAMRREQRPARERGSRGAAPAAPLDPVDRRAGFARDDRRQRLPAAVGRAAIRGGASLGSRVQTIIRPATRAFALRRSLAAGRARRRRRAAARSCLLCRVAPGGVAARARAAARQRADGHAGCKNEQKCNARHGTGIPRIARGRIRCPYSSPARALWSTTRQSPSIDRLSGQTYIRPFNSRWL